jgi:hypothetical protein
MKEAPVALVLYDRATALDGQDPCFLHYAAERGLRTYAVGWRDVDVQDDGTYLRRGWEALGDGWRRLDGWERIEPAIVLHRKYVWGRSLQLVSWIGQAHPHAYLSFHPLWDEIGSKWSAELCFRAGARAGIEVARPETYLVPNDELEMLRPLAAAEPLVYKPSYGCESRGIWLSTPDNFEDVIARVPHEGPSSYVVQKVVADPLLYRGRRFDLRIYALATSFAPLRLRVYREGVVRVAAEPYDPARRGEYLRTMTGWSFLYRHGAPILNLPVSRLLAELGLDADQFWDDAESLLQNAFACLERYAEMLWDDGLERRFFLCGTDVMMTRSDTHPYRLLLVETNDVPGLTPWGPEIDDALEPVHRGWVEDLARLAVARAPTRARPRRARVTLAVVHAQPSAFSQWARGRSSALVQTARALAADSDVRVVLCPWHQVELRDGETVVAGPLAQVTDERVEPLQSGAPLRLAALVIFPSSGAGSPDTAAERSALARIGGDGLDRNAALARLALEAARRGAATNAPGVDGRFGRKDQLEFALRLYTRATGRRVARPETYAVPASQLDVVVASFAAQGAACVVKPANGARGEGIAVVEAGSAAPAIAAGDVVVQELVEEPLMVDGCKADLRCYVLINSARPVASRRVGPVLARLAPAPYVPGLPEAEIANTAHRRRLGLPPAIHPLDELRAVPAALQRTLIAELDDLIAELLAAHAWWAGEHGDGQPPRVLLWGLDVAVTLRGGPRVLLLEVNPHCQLFRGVAACDALVAEMLRREFLPTLLEAAR